jgi:hypothetical protein
MRRVRGLDFISVTDSDLLIAYESAERPFVQNMNANSRARRSI